MTNVMPTNVEQNATLWDNYAREWSKDKGFVTKMLEDNQYQAGDDGVILGEEWSDKASFLEVVVRQCECKACLGRILETVH